jgi:hypothetical protein
MNACRINAHGVSVGRRSIYEARRTVHRMDSDPTG